MCGVGDLFQILFLAIGVAEGESCQLRVGPSLDRVPKPRRLCHQDPDDAMSSSLSTFLGRVQAGQVFPPANESSDAGTGSKDVGMSGAHS